MYVTVLEVLVPRVGEFLVGNTAHQDGTISKTGKVVLFKTN